MDTLLNQNSGSVTKSLPQLNDMKLSQQEVVDVGRAMYTQTGRLARPNLQPDGTVLLLPNQLGPNQLIMAVNINGRIATGTATLSVDVAAPEPLKATDVKIDF